MQVSYEALKVEIDNIKDDIKEIKEDQKETNRYYRDTIEVLKQNQLQQTEILKNQERQFQQQFSELTKDITGLNDDVNSLRTDMHNTVESQTKWYQDFLNNNFGFVVKTLVILVLLLAGVKLVGFDIGKFLGL